MRKLKIFTQKQRYYTYIQRKNLFEQYFQIEAGFLFDQTDILFQNKKIYIAKTKMKITRKNPHLPLSVLSLPPKNQFIETSSPSSQYSLYYVASEKICIEAYRIQVQKTKLYTNLEIYQWRHQTQFPIAKTKYVSIQPNHQPLSDIMELIVFNEHCPLKLHMIYEMKMTQALYVLKQAIIGFQRLYNKFGTFQITEGTIAINQKGFCRVWLNENFSVNFPSRSEVSEQKMIAAIYEIMERHCQQSRTSRKLFEKIKQTKTFLSALKEIDFFITAEKIIVPSRFTLSSSFKQNSLQFNSNNLYKSDNKLERASQPRYSINSINSWSSIRQSNHQNAKIKENTSEMDILKFNSSPSEIKRFKSEDKLRICNIMKVSDGQTAHTRNIKCSNTGYYNSPKGLIAQKNLPDKSSFVIEVDDAKDQNKRDKKQLSYSEAVIGSNQSSDKKITGKYRKLSANINPADNFFYKFNSNIKKSQNESYTDEFNSILGNDESPSTPRSRIMQEEEEQKLREEISDNIMKNNGWNGLSGFMNIQKQMKESFHEGHQEISPRHQITLSKLDSIGRRPVAMSILPQQYQTNII